MAANFWRAWWAWLITFVLTIVISLFTRPAPREKLVGLVKGLTEVPGSGHLPLYRRPAFMAIVALAIAILLNILFW